VRVWVTFGLSRSWGKVRYRCTWLTDRLIDWLIDWLWWFPFVRAFVWPISKFCGCNLNNELQTRGGTRPHSVVQSIRHLTATRRTDASMPETAVGWIRPPDTGRRQCYGKNYPSWVQRSCVIFSPYTVLWTREYHYCQMSSSLFVRWDCDMAITKALAPSWRASRYQKERIIIDWLTDKRHTILNTYYWNLSYIDAFYRLLNDLIMCIESSWTLNLATAQATLFTARCYAERGIAMASCLSVCLSVCP